jgi:hypothetical protein
LSSQVLAAGTSCVLSFDFIPTVAGSNNGDATLTDNTLNATNATQIIPLYGNGIANVTQLSFATPPATSIAAGGNAGSSIIVNELNASSALATSASDLITLTVTGPNSYSQSYTATAVSGVATFNNLASVPLTKAGGYTYTAAIVASPSITAAVAPETVIAASAATVTSSTGSGQSAIIGATFGTALQVTVTDTYNNPVQGATVTFSAPTATAGAIFNSSPATTDANGMASTLVKANAFAGSYTVTAAVSGAASANFSLTNTQATPATTINPTPASSITYGQAATAISSVVSYSIGTPTGTVTFKDGSTVLGTGTLSGGSTTLPSPGYLAAGNHQLVGIYNADANYYGSTSATNNYAVNQAPVTLTAAGSQTVQALSTTSTVSATITGAYTGAGILVPGAAGGATAACSFYSGSTLVASSSAAVVAGSGASSAACPVPSAVTATSGNYTVTVAFNGDSNYLASGASTAGGAGNSLNFSFTVQPLTPTITWAPPSSATNVVYGTLLGSALSASASYNSNSVAGTWTYTATKGGSTVTVGSGTMLQAGTYTLTATFTPTNTAAYNTNNSTLTYVVTQATPGITVATSASPVWIGATVTYTATVTGVSGGLAPSGIVTFYDGATALGTASLNGNGQASLSGVPATSGTHLIKATVAADNNYVTSTSSALSQVAVDFTVAVASTGSSSASVLPGVTATYNLVVTPVGNTAFPGAITFSVSGLPAGATATFSPASIASGAAATNMTLSIATSATTLVQNHAEGVGRKLMPFALALLFLPLAGFRRARKLWMRSLMVLVLLAGSLAATVGMTGCSLPSGYFGQTPKTFTVTVTGNNGSFTRTTNVTLTVE